MAMNILEFIDFCMDEWGLSEDEANHLADLEFSLDPDED